MATIPPYKETRNYEKNKYWNSYRWTKTGLEASVGMHYDDSLEINFFFNTVVDAHIGGNRYTIKEDCVVLIMPNVIHSFTYESGNGTIIAANIDTKRLKPIFNMDALLAHYDIQVQSLPIFLPMDDTLKELAQEFLAMNSLTDCVIAFTKLFNIAKSKIATGSDVPKLNTSYNNEMNFILTWTRQNMDRKISIDEIAQKLGYNKSYFCRKFKAEAGMTYIEFVNHIRIHHAHSLLKRGYSITQARDACGFDDTSYFIKLFKKHIGLTPKKFVESLNADSLHKKS